MSLSSLQDLRGKERYWMVLYELRGELNWKSMQAPNGIEAVKKTGINPNIITGVFCVDHKDFGGQFFPKFRGLAEQVLAEAKQREAEREPITAEELASLKASCETPEDHAIYETLARAAGQ